MIRATYSDPRTSNAIQSPDDRRMRRDTGEDLRRLVRKAYGSAAETRCIEVSRNALASVAPGITLSIPSAVAFASRRPARATLESSDAWHSLIGLERNVR